MPKLRLVARSAMHGACHASFTRTASEHNTGISNTVDRVKPAAGGNRTLHGWWNAQEKTD